MVSILAVLTMSCRTMFSRFNCKTTSRNSVPIPPKHGFSHLHLSLSIQVLLQAGQMASSFDTASSHPEAVIVLKNSSFSLRLQSVLLEILFLDQMVLLPKYYQSFSSCRVIIYTMQHQRIDKRRWRKPS